jgi:hypothetical protein
MLTIFAALGKKMANIASLKLSVSAIIDDVETVGADLQRTSNGNMKKLIIVSFLLIYSEHAHLLCSFMPKICESPLFEVVYLGDY